MRFSEVCSRNPGGLRFDMRFNRQLAAPAAATGMGAAFDVAAHTAADAAAADEAAADLAAIDPAAGPAARGDSAP